MSLQNFPKIKVYLALGGVLAAFLLFVLLEVVLTLFKVGEPRLQQDPFFDFGAHTGLFEIRTDQDPPSYHTRPSKLAFFNEQSFPVEKDPDSFRVFALGGSTTYGRPYDWRVSFPYWIEQLVNNSQPDRKLEMINAGGVSYASYRLKVLMQELVQYQPDLFIVYTGHNEFLEERVYGDELRENALVKYSRQQLSGLRTTRLLKSLLSKQGEAPAPRQTLQAEVKTRLDVWQGINSFKRDSQLFEDVTLHFEWNLEQMIKIARDAGVPIIFVKPESNLVDFSPFKSDHDPQTSAEAAKSIESWLKQARQAFQDQQIDEADSWIDKVLAIDPRFADANFLKAKVQLARGDTQAAANTFRKVLTLDACPLRCPPVLQDKIEIVAARAGVPLVDLPALLQTRVVDHGLPGNESFLDHVHPRIEVHQLIAEACVEIMADQQWPTLGKTLSADERTAIYAERTAHLNDTYYAKRDLNLAKVLGWAGKYEEGLEAARRARAVLEGDPDVHYNLGILLERQGRPNEAVKEYERAIASEADFMEAWFNYGKSLQKLNRNPEAAGAFKKAKELADDDCMECTFNLARSLLYAGSAQQAYEVIENLSGDFPGYHLLKGQTLRELGKTQEAGIIMELGAKQNPEDPQLQYNLALIKVNLGETDVGVNLLKKTISLDPFFVDAYSGLAEIYERRNQEDEVLSTYQQALTNVGRHPRMLFELGLYHHKQKRLDEATRLYEETIAKDATYERAHNNLGIIWGLKGDYPKAIAALTQTVTLNPKAGSAYHNLAQLKLASGDRGGARNDLKQAIALGVKPSAQLLASLDMSL